MVDRLWGPGNGAGLCSVCLIVATATRHGRTYGRSRDSAPSIAAVRALCVFVLQGGVICFVVYDGERNEDDPMSWLLNAPKDGGNPSWIVEGSKFIR